jgi:hypothetical protein
MLRIARKTLNIRSGGQVPCEQLLCSNFGIDPTIRILRNAISKYSGIFWNVSAQFSAMGLKVGDRRESGGITDPNFDRPRKVTANVMVTHKKRSSAELRHTQALLVCMV